MGVVIRAIPFSRAPYGARGLKLNFMTMWMIPLSSRPVWGAWIEINMHVATVFPGSVAPRMGRVD